MAVCAFSVVALTAFGVVDPMAGGDARLVALLLSTYALLAASLGFCGAGTEGDEANVRTLLMVCAPVACTYTESAASRVRNCAATLVGTSFERTAEMVVLGVAGTIQNSVSVVPSFRW